MKTNNEKSDTNESFDSSALLSDHTLTEYWGFEREAGIACYHRVKWLTKKKADIASGEILREDPTIICIHRLKERPKGVKVG